VYSHRKADTPEARDIFASRIFCPSIKAKINLNDSAEQDVGVDGKGPPKLDSASLILPIGHENSKAISLSWSVSLSSFSVGRRITVKIHLREVVSSQFQRRVEQKISSHMSINEIHNIKSDQCFHVPQ